MPLQNEPKVGKALFRVRSDDSELTEVHVKPSRKDLEDALERLLTKHGLDEVLMALQDVTQRGPRKRGGAA